MTKSLVAQRCDPLYGKALHNFGNMLHYSHTPQILALFELQIFEMGWGETCHFLELI